MKPVAEGDTNEGEFMLVKKNGRGFLFASAARRRCGMTILFLPIDFWYLSRRRARPRNFILRVDALVIKGSALTPTPSTALKKFDEPTTRMNVLAAAFLLLNPSKCELLA